MVRKAARELVANATPADTNLLPTWPATSGQEPTKTTVSELRALLQRALASQAEAEAGADNVKGMTPLRTAQAIAALASAAGVTSVGATGIVTAGDGATITEADHSQLFVDATALKVRIVLLRHATTPSSPIAVTVADGLTKGLLFVVADDQTGLVTIQRQTTATINGDTSEELTEAGALASLIVRGTNDYILAGDIRGASQLWGALLAAGNEISGNVAKTGTRTGALVVADSGGYFRTTGNVTIPQTAGFSVTLKAGGAHTVTFGATTSAAMAVGDMMSILVDDQLAIDAVLTAAADKVAFS